MATEPYWMTNNGEGTREQPHILWDGGEGLIVADDGGAWYTNQTGGVSCHHPVACGRFEARPVPSSIAGMLTDCLGLSEEMAAAVDAIFVRYGMGMRVDRDLLASSEEAWVHVVLDDGRAGILTWENSD